jgi:hypothetical protein
MLSGTLRKRIGLLAVTLIAVASIGAQSRPWRQMCDANPTVCEDQECRAACLDRSPFRLHPPRVSAVRSRFATSSDVRLKQ